MGSEIKEKAGKFETQRKLSALVDGIDGGLTLARDGHTCPQASAALRTIVGEWIDVVGCHNGEPRRATGSQLP